MAGTCASSLPHDGENAGVKTNWPQRCHYEIFCAVFTDSDGDGLGFGMGWQKAGLCSRAGATRNGLCQLCLHCSQVWCDDYKGIHSDKWQLWRTFKNCWRKQISDEYQDCVDLIINQVGSWSSWFEGSSKRTRQSLRDLLCMGRKRTHRRIFNKQKEYGWIVDNIANGMIREMGEDFYYGLFFIGGMPEFEFWTSKSSWGIMNG